MGKTVVVVRDTPGFIVNRILMPYLAGAMQLLVESGGALDIQRIDAAMTRATRVRTEAFLKETGAQMWIQHDPPTNAKLRKAPEFYD